MFIPWTDDLLMGIAAIDRQHKWLVDATNQLHEEVSRPEPDRGAIFDLLMGLVEYTCTHFTAEEDVFQRFGYPDADGHRAQHKAFAARINALIDAHERGDNTSLEALEFLKQWLLHHILESDQAYAPFLKMRGAA